uniref:Peptidase M13 N-terminal domain-containing protein n=1 Tax=Trichogramma kaykai TaxID=54128 RepID=A0ABD2WUX6_9HYME
MTTRERSYKATYHRIATNEDEVILFVDQRYSSTDSLLEEQQPDYDMRYKVNDPESANQPPASAVTTTEDNSWSKQQDNEKSARTKQTRLIIVVGLLAVAVIALVVTLTLQTTIFGASGGSGESKEMCQSEECIKTAARMIENLNKSVDPCEDFYDFACGGWIARNPIPQSESVWDQLISLHEELSQKLRLLLEEPDQPGEPRGVKMARAYYRTCLDTDSMEKLGMEPIYEVMAKLKLPRNIPEDDLNPPELDVAWLAGNAHRLIKLHLMVNFFISEDPRNGTLNRMMLEQVSPVLPDRHLLDQERFKSEIDEYKKYAKSMLELAGVGKRSGEFAQEIVDFSTQLAGILNTPEERRSPNHMFHDLSFQDLQMTTDMNAAQWNWTTYINGVFNDTDVKIDAAKEKVIVVDMTYLQKLPQLLVLTPSSVIGEYNNLIAYV